MEFHADSRLFGPLRRVTNRGSTNDLSRGIAFGPPAEVAVLGPGEADLDDEDDVAVEDVAEEEVLLDARIKFRFWRRSSEKKCLEVRPRQVASIASRSSNMTI